MAISLVVFICAGAALGWGNSRFTRRAVARITESGASAGRVAGLSLARLFVLTAISVTVAYLVRPAGVGIIFGLALFHAATLLRYARPIVRGQT